MDSQAEKTKHLIEVLLASGVTSKKQLYSRLETRTGLPRPTLRRIAGEYRKELERKLKILTDVESKKT